MTDDLVIHQAPWQDWYATQDAARGVLLCNKASDEKVKVGPLAGGWMLIQKNAINPS
jgi:hypothetical protein